MNIASNLLNKAGANKKTIFAVKSSNIVVTISEFNDFFILYNGLKNEATKHNIKELEKAHEMCNRRFVKIETYIFNS